MKKESDLTLWVMGFAALCITGGWIWGAYRMNEGWQAYLMAPVAGVCGLLLLMLSGAVSGLILSLLLEKRGIKMGEGAAMGVGYLIWFVIGCLIFINSREFAELKWGAPTLVRINGGQMEFAEGKVAPLRLRDLSEEGSRRLAQRIGQRMTLKDCRYVQNSILMDGHAKSNEPSWAEDYAKKRRYGVWGGGSEERDLQLLKELRERLGDDTIRDELGEDY